MGNYHHQPRKKPAWLWLLLGLGVVIWLLQPQVEEPSSFQIPTGTHYTRALPEIQRVEIEVERPETAIRAFMADRWIADGQRCCQAAFTHTATYETGNDSWLSIEAFLDDEVTITTTLTYAYDVSVYLGDAELGNIREATDHWSDNKTPRRYIQIHLPNPVVNGPVLIREETEYPKTEIQDLVEWIKTHGNEEQNQREIALTQQALIDARQAFEKRHPTPSWSALARTFPAECTQKKRQLQNGIADAIEALFPQDDIRGFTTVLPQWH